jgi:hypothetical protein
MSSGEEYKNEPQPPVRLTHSTGTAELTSDQLRHLLGSAPGDAVVNAAVRVALHQSLHLTFSSVLVISIGAVVSLLLVPTIKLVQRSEPTTN